MALAHVCVCVHGQTADPLQDPFINHRVACWELFPSAAFSAGISSFLVRAVDSEERADELTHFGPMKPLFGQRKLNPSALWFSFSRRSLCCPVRVNVDFLCLGG